MCFEIGSVELRTFIPPQLSYELCFELQHAPYRPSLAICTSAVIALLSESPSCSLSYLKETDIPDLYSVFYLFTCSKPVYDTLE